MSHAICVGQLQQWSIGLIRKHPLGYLGVVAGTDKDKTWTCLQLMQAVCLGLVHTLPRRELDAPVASSVFSPRHNRGCRWEAALGSVPSQTM
jgi:hypothetical protein